MIFKIQDFSRLAPKAPAGIKEKIQEEKATWTADNADTSPQKTSLKKP